VPGVRIDAEKKLGQRLDIRGEGGYVVVPPSVVQEDGRTGTYTWVRSPFEHLAVMPP